MPPIDAFFLSVIIFKFISNIGHNFKTHIIGKHTILIKPLKW